MHAHLIDASGYMYRAYYATPAMAKADGTPVGAVHGYCEMLRGLLTRDCTHRAVILDGGRSGRQQIDAAYKANRAPRPPELTSQLAMLEEATAAWGVACVRADGWEADDVIATYARQITADGGQVTIFSSDKDLLPLLDLDGVAIYCPLKKQDITPAICAQNFGVAPAQVLDLLALWGDSIDNVPGVDKVGKKTAAALLNAHGSLAEILRLAQTNPYGLQATASVRSSLSMNVDAALLSRKLVELQAVPWLPDIETARATVADPEALVAWLRRMEFALLAHEVETAFQVAA